MCVWISLRAWLTIAMLKGVFCNTMFDLKLVRFHNPHGVESDGDCCDFPCSDPCDPLIKICFDKPSQTRCHDSSTTRYTGHYHLNTFNFQSTFANKATNPMNLDLDSWSGSIVITVIVEDKDAINANDPMGTKAVMFTKVPAANKAAAEWHTINFQFAHSQMLLAQARVYCQANYFGPECKTFCAPANSNSKGHYTCASNGSKTCNQNYHGASCKTFCKPSDDDTGHFTCDATGKQVCLKGWAGPGCKNDINECVSPTENPCAPNGQCNNTIGSYSCTCNEEYTGLNCQEVKLYCDDMPCSNTSTCNDTFGGFQCTCGDGWTGKKCDERVTPCTYSPCINDGVCNVTGMHYTCKCVGPWTGQNCDVEVETFYNDTKTLFLRGNLPRDKWSDLQNGIKHLIEDVIGVTDPTIETRISHPNEKLTKVYIFVESKDPKAIDCLDKIVGLPQDEVVQSLILPLTDDDMFLEPQILKPDPWVKKHWYVVLVVVVVIIGVVAIIAVVLYILKKRRRNQMKKADLGPRASVASSLPDAAVGFDNSLYFEVNKPDKVSGLPGAKQYY